MKRVWNLEFGNWSLKSCFVQAKPRLQLPASRLILSACLLTPPFLLHAQPFASETKTPNAVALVTSSITAPIITDVNDDWLIQKAAGLLQTDINAVTGQTPALLHDTKAAGRIAIIIGSLNKSSLISALVRSKKIIADPIRGQWEAYHLQVVNNPFPGIEKALVITGSDKRGTAYGVFTLAQEIGISPWYWWADVPAKQKKEIYVNGSLKKSDAPAVKYRGIFINDEAPAFSGWAKEKFGGVNHFVYEKMFELILRLKGNYLWPAMWGRAFNDDDTLDPILADQWGVVMGTSHHEPMLRAQAEWKRYGKGEWNYQKNDSVLRTFWRKGIENMGTHESIVTIGMRGDGDMPMTQGSNIALLERIVADQRKIIEDVTKKPASQTPQLWALYKEVQDYYDKGMRVPDDITLLLCDDNWGNIRKLPQLSDAPRKGGYGIYYHFDYVGGPRNYKWINTNSIERTWEQMHLAYEYGVRNIWIVNVGDLKPMEYPISFFLDYAWKPSQWNASNIHTYAAHWAAQEFGSKYGEEIGTLLSAYTKYNSRRKPELLDANTYSVTNYEESRRVNDAYAALHIQAEATGKKLPAAYADAYYELVLHPIKASSNLQSLYTAVAYNRWFAGNKWLVANKQADKAKEFYRHDSLISIEYHQLAGGKWNHMMDQTHIGYVFWQEPLRNRMPAVQYVSPDSAQQPTLITPKPIPARSLVPADETKNISVETNGYLSTEAARYTSAVNTNGITWQTIKNIGRTGDGVSPFPVTAKTQIPQGNAPRLEYEMYFYKADSVKLMAYFSPTLNFHNDEGLQYAVSFDNETPQIVSINKDDNNQRLWGEWVSNDIIIKTTRHNIATPGKHVLKFWMVNPGIVLQKLVVDAGGVKPSYLGPPETK